MEGTGELWGLRREIVRHPVKDWATGSIDHSTLLVHRAFSQWGSSRLATALGLPGAYGHVAEALVVLHRMGAGRCVDRFLRAIEEGWEPAAALGEAGGPAAAYPLVEAVAGIVGHGSEVARLGALGMGLPCCPAHRAAAIERLAGAEHEEATAAAVVVLEAEIVLYDGALAMIRNRRMAEHPSRRRPAALHLLPTG